MRYLLLLALLPCATVAETHEQIMQHYVNYTMASLGCVHEITQAYPEKPECDKYLKFSKEIIKDPDYMANLEELERILPSITVRDLYRYSVFIDDYYRKAVEYHY